MSTPCVNFCWIEPGQYLCEGCGRTRDEIAGWYLLREDQRLAIMAGLKLRMAAAGLKSRAPDAGASA